MDCNAATGMYCTAVRSKVEKKKTQLVVPVFSENDIDTMPLIVSHKRNNLIETPEYLPRSDLEGRTAWINIKTFKMLRPTAVEATLKL